MPTQRAPRHARHTHARGRTSRLTALFEPLDPRVLMSGTPVDIEGVYDAALDQPRQYALLRRTPTGDPLTAVDPLFGDETFTIEAFYDTGASGVLISKETADAMGVERATYNGEPVQFEDVGVNGSEFFDVSEPLYTALAPYGADRDLDNPDTFESVYTQQFGPLRMQVSQQEVDPFLGTPLDVWGMPAMNGKVVVMDARPPSSDTDLGVMRTYTYNPGTPYNAAEDTNDPGIPQTNFHLKLSYASFERFTDVTPAGAPGPTLLHNPFIGPNPVRSIDPTLPPDNTPGITVSRGSKSVTGSWLFDTGAVASMLSEHSAAAIGVHYAVPDPDPSQPPRLIDDQGNTIPDQFTLDIGGIGGSSTVAGFYLDSLVLPTQEGQPIRYLRAPVLVHDVSTADPKTGQALTLDGVFGMNFLVASMDVNGADLGDVHGGAYDWLTFDEPHGVLGLNIPTVAAPAPAVSAVYVRGSAWTPGFKAYMEGQNLGDDVLGYRVDNKPAGDIAPWSNVDEIVLRYSGAPTGGGIPTPGTITLDGVRSDYTVTAVTQIDPQTFALRLDRPLGADRVRLTVNGGGAAGSNYGQTLNVLPGDVDRSGSVLAQDYSDVKSRFFRSTAAPGPAGGAQYSVFDDVDANGTILANDFSIVKARFFSDLPPAAAASVASGEDPVVVTTAAVSAPRRRSLFGGESDLLGRLA